jgi:hypothetical protein
VLAVGCGDPSSAADDDGVDDPEATASAMQDDSSMMGSTDDSDETSADDESNGGPEAEDDSNPAPVDADGEASDSDGESVDPDEMQDETLADDAGDDGAEADTGDSDQTEPDPASTDDEMVDDPDPGSADEDAVDDPNPGSTDDDPNPDTQDEDPSDITVVPGGDYVVIPAEESAAFLQASTVSQRVGLPLSAQHQILDAQALANQLDGYDPGSLLRCELLGQGAYEAAVDQLGGVSWGYSVGKLEDQSKPRLMAGFQEPYIYDAVPGTADAGNAADPVEIVLPDIVAVTESAALFYSAAHGILLVDVSGAEPQFVCANQLPGQVDQFFFHQGHLVAMTRGYSDRHSYLLHFEVSGLELRFIEAVDLGDVNILDSRRFNEKLVFYTDLRLPESPDEGVNPSGGVYDTPVYYQPQALHRALRVFNLGDILEEELYDTLIDETLAEDQLVYEAVTPETEIGAVVSESRSFGGNMWASDHYFVVTEAVRKTILAGRQTRTYSVCTASHTEQIPYQYCWTEYEEQPNPDYVPPDNNGGDRSCQGQTLSDCLREVARVSNETIMVPVARHCETRERHKWVCDARESRSVEYPVFQYDYDTQLYIYEYNEDGFVRLDSQVHEIENDGLENQSEDASVPVLTTSTETFDLAVPGAVQTLYFQNGYLYVISEGILQVYTMGGSSMVRTSTLPVVNETLQSSLFSENKLFLSDFGWAGGDHSTLKVVNLDNPAFPTAEASTHELPGGHRSIIASNFGIFTVGSVTQFEGQTINALKLGLFSDPYVEETAYSILATDLNGAWLGDERAQLFDGASQRFLLPYYGRDDDNHTIHRIGVSELTADAILSEGAVVVPEAAQRVRGLPANADEYLSFATNSIYNLASDGAEWAAEPVLEYYQPFAVYRLNEEDDYVEVQRLGDRCRLYFSNAADINQRDRDTTTEEFPCVGYGVTAYANQLLFAENGIEFDADEYTFRFLTEEELAETRQAIAERTICLLSLDFVPNPYYIDYQNLPAEVEVVCVHPNDLNALQQAVTEQQQQ